MPQRRRDGIGLFLRGYNRGIMVLQEVSLYG